MGKVIEVEEGQSLGSRPKGKGMDQMVKSDKLILYFFFSRNSQVGEYLLLYSTSAFAAIPRSHTIDSEF